MYKILSPKTSEHTFGINVVALDCVDFHFLQSSPQISCSAVSQLIGKMIQSKKEHDFSLIEDFGPAKIGILRISDPYFDYFKQTDFVGFEGSITFCAEVTLDDLSERYVLWPLMSENLYMVSQDMVQCKNDFSCSYEQKTNLSSKTEDCLVLERPYVKKISFSRVYRTDKKKLISVVSSVSVVRDEVTYQGFYKDYPNNFCINRTEFKEPMWLIRHKDEVQFLKNVLLDSGIPVEYRPDANGFVDEAHF